jgi:ribonucrease Y
MWLVVLGVMTVLVAAAVLAVVVAVTRRSTTRTFVGTTGTESPTASRTWLDPLVASRADSPHSEAEALIHQSHASTDGSVSASDGSAVSVTSGDSESSRPAPELSAPAARASAPARLTDQHQAEKAAADAVQHALASLREREDEMRALRRDLHDQHLDIERREQRLAQREERLDEVAYQLDERASELARRDEELAAERAALLDLASERRTILERLSELTAEEAKAELVADIERDAKREAAVTVRDLERAAHEEGDARARNILATAIQRLASEQTAESVVSLVRLPGDDMKGRIIGREGRNIRAFEQTTGVNLIIDDTPEAVVLSCFDPVRREVGRITLEELVADGRIHPSRIEEVYQRSLTEIDRLCQRAGEDALMEVAVTEVHPHLVYTLGQLRYRTSYGQSVLKHCVESAHAAGLLAAELGVDGTVVKRAALLHDIGKALTHEAEGSHALVGAELANRYGESPDIVHAIEAHHNEVEPRTIEAVLTQAADAISGGRPGARRESPEAYVRRLERLEEIAMACDGVDKVFAMQAGREVRVMVVPDVVDEIGAQVMARDIAKQIEHELTYPGQIKVTVIRESRTTEIAR